MIINHHTTWARSGYGILFDKFLVHYRALLRGQNFGPAKTSCKGETTTNHMSRRCQVHNGDGLDAFYAYYSKRNSACTVNTQLLCIIHCNYTNTLSCQWLTYSTGLIPQYPTDVEFQEKYASLYLDIAGDCPILIVWETRARCSGSCGCERNLLRPRPKRLQLEMFLEIQPIGGTGYVVGRKLKENTVIVVSILDLSGFMDRNCMAYIMSSN